MTRRARTVLGLVVALGAAGSVGSVAEARSGTAPVTAPDTVATYPGNLATIRPLRNDSDPEGDKLTICGLGPEKYPGIRVDVFDDLKDFDVQVRQKAGPGTYLLTYYACDGTSATPGTVTLTVLKPPRITVRKVPGHPGQLRLTNGASFRIRILYGDYTRDDAEGDLKMPKKSSVVVTTRYTRVDWFAFAARSGESLRSGHVRGISPARFS